MPRSFRHADARKLHLYQCLTNCRTKSEKLNLYQCRVGPAHRCSESQPLPVIAWCQTDPQNTLPFSTFLYPSLFFSTLFYSLLCLGLIGETGCLPMFQPARSDPRKTHRLSMFQDHSTRSGVDSMFINVLSEAEFK